MDDECLRPIFPEGWEAKEFGEEGAVFYQNGATRETKTVIPEDVGWSDFPQWHVEHSEVVVRRDLRGTEIQARLKKDDLVEQVGPACTISVRRAAGVVTEDRVLPIRFVRDGIGFRGWVDLKTAGAEEIVNRAELTAGGGWCMYA